MHLLKNSQISKIVRHREIKLIKTFKTSIDKTTFKIIREHKEDLNF